MFKKMIQMKSPLIKLIKLYFFVVIKCDEQVDEFSRNYEAAAKYLTKIIELKKTVDQSNE